MSEKQMVDRETLEAAFRLWEEERRTGKCMSNEEAAALPIDERVQRSAEAFLVYPQTVSGTAAAAA